MKYQFQIIIVVCAMISGKTMALTVTTSTGNGADSYIWAAGKSTNYGTSQVIAVKRDTGLGNSRKGYLRFDFGSTLETVTDATLDLYYSGTNTGIGNKPANPSTYTVYGLNDGHLHENWSETGITWNNAPGNITSSSSGFNSSETTYLGTFDINFNTTSAGDKVSFTSQALINFLNDDSNGLVTLLLSRKQANFSIEYFSSKEHTLLPDPTLTVNTVPLPASFYLFGSALIVLYARKRSGKTET